MRARITNRRLLTGVAIAVILAIGLAVSLWTILVTSSGTLVLAWCVAWSLVAGIAGWHLRTWFWPGLCPAAMLFLVLFWVTLFGRSSWISAIVTVLGMMFAVAAAIGAVLGTWLGKRHLSQR
jgi:hypothetical protein